MATKEEKRVASDFKGKSPRQEEQLILNYEPLNPEER
jgi:hypothetical protein